MDEPEMVSSTSISVNLEVNGTGGDNPRVYVLADTLDQGTIFCMTYRLDLGYLGIGDYSEPLVVWLLMKVFIRFTENSVGNDWTGKSLRYERN